MSQQASQRTEPVEVAVVARSASEVPHLIDPRPDEVLDFTVAADARATGVNGVYPTSRRDSPTSDADSISERPFASAAKRVVDIVGALLLAILFSPLMIAASVLLARGGSVLYRHRRIGAGGRVFECLKFRTMVPDAERVLDDLLANDTDLMAEWLHSHKLRDDPRVTPVGRFLRRTSLDELPQLWNVLRGEMSLVGPRPIVREELLRYGRNVAVYLSVRPGITGLWQTTGRNDIDYRRRVVMDVYYVRNRTFWLDAYILLRTIAVVLGGNGAY